MAIMAVHSMFLWQLSYHMIRNNHVGCGYKKICKVLTTVKNKSVQMRDMVLFVSKLIGSGKFFF